MPRKWWSNRLVFHVPSKHDCIFNYRKNQEKKGGDTGNELSTINGHLCPRARTRMMGIPPLGVPNLAQPQTLMLLKHFLTTTVTSVTAVTTWNPWRQQSGKKVLFWIAKRHLWMHIADTLSDRVRACRMVLTFRDDFLWGYTDLVVSYDGHLTAPD